MERPLVPPAAYWPVTRHQIVFVTANQIHFSIDKLYSLFQEGLTFLLHRQIKEQVQVI